MKKDVKRVQSEVEVKQTESLEKSVAKELTVEDRDIDQILKDHYFSEARKNEDTK